MPKKTAENDNKALVARCVKSAKDLKGRKSDLTTARTKANKVLEEAREKVAKAEKYIEDIDQIEADIAKAAKDVGLRRKRNRRKKRILKRY